MYKELVGDDNEMYAIQLNIGKGKKVHTGVFERYILCFECDNETLGKLETYASRILNGPRYAGVTMQNQRNQFGVVYAQCEGVDYTTFKLFLFSLLWRMSIASGGLFKQVSLGDQEEVLRKMIYEHVPGSSIEYPCVISTYRSHAHLPKAVIGEAIHFDSSGDKGYGILISGFHYMFLWPGHSQMTDLQELFLNESGRLRVVHMPEDDAKKLLNHSFTVNMF